MRLKHPWTEFVQLFVVGFFIFVALEVKSNPHQNPPSSHGTETHAPVSKAQKSNLKKQKKGHKEGMAADLEGHFKSEEEIRKSMITMSRQLGVTCTYCHEDSNLKSDKKPTFHIAKSHMQIVEELQQKHGATLGGQVDCYMCHRGQAKPAFKEKIEIPE